jgi:ubiquinone/menaquinone biosynthesis C-methylase UbiE
MIVAWDPRGSMRLRWTWHSAYRSSSPGEVLEIACAGGLATRRVRERLDPTVRPVATDLSRAMLDYARDRLRDSEPLEWREADAANLPFGNGEHSGEVIR